MKKVLVTVIFVLLAMSAFAQPSSNYLYSEPTKQFYFDLSLGGFMPSGSYYDTTPVDLDLKGSLNFGIDFNFYMNDYIGINAMLAVTGAESEEYSGVYADVSIFYLGGGLAARYRVSKLLELYGNAGIAIASASYSLSHVSGISTADSDSEIAFAGYIGGGVRIFPGSGTFYMLGSMRYVVAGKAEYELLYGDRAEIGLSGLMISAGAGIAF